MTTFITTPMLNVNDDGAFLSAWLKSHKAYVNKGEIIAVLETSKATVDLEAEESGYLHLFVEAGKEVPVGEVLGAICETADDTPEPPQLQAKPEVAQNAERRITKKAEIVAARAGLNSSDILSLIPGDAPITESDIIAHLGQSHKGTSPQATINGDLVDDAYPQSRRQRLLIIGGGLGAVQLLDSLSRIEHQQATAIVDDNRELTGKTVLGVPILGGRESIEELFQKGIVDAAVVSVSTSIPFRAEMSSKLTQLKIPMANVIDPTARIQRNAIVGGGNVILAYCHIGACAVVGDGNFLSPYVDIEHHCTIGNNCTFGPGVMMSSLVKVESHVKFGTGIFIEPKLSIGSESIIGSGAILTRNIPPYSVVKTKVNYTIRARSGA
jgi:sugar O-acyltransferase (sialic acid O-acetyltransferase NeuD family)